MGRQHAFFVIVSVMVVVPIPGPRAFLFPFYLYERSYSFRNGISPPC